MLAIFELSDDLTKHQVLVNDKMQGFNIVVEPKPLLHDMMETLNISALLTPAKELSFMPKGSQLVESKEDAFTIPSSATDDTVEVIKQQLGFG